MSRVKRVSVHKIFFCGGLVRDTVSKSAYRWTVHDLGVVVRRHSESLRPEWKCSVSREREDVDVVENY